MADRTRGRAGEAVARLRTGVGDVPGEQVRGVAVGEGQRGLEVAELLADAEVELIGPRRLHVVVEQEDLARTGGGVEQRIKAGRGQIGRVPGDGVDAAAHAAGHGEEDLLVELEGLEALVEGEVEADAVVVAAGAAEDHRPLVVEDVEREADPRLEGAGEGVAAVGDVVRRVEVGREVVARQRLNGVQRVADGLRRRIVVVDRIVLIVPAQAEIDFQLAGDLPVVLDVEAEDVVIDVSRRDLGAEFDTDRDIPAAVDLRARVDVEDELRVPAELLVHVHVLGREFHAHLDGVLAVPFDVVERQVVAEREAALANVLVVALTSGVEDRVFAVEHIVLEARRARVVVPEDDVRPAVVREVQSGRVVGVLIEVELGFVEEAVALVLVTQDDRGHVGVDLVRAAVGVVAAEVADVGLGAVGCAQVEALAVVD